MTVEWDDMMHHCMQTGRKRVRKEGQEEGEPRGVVCMCVCVCGHLLNMGKLQLDGLGVDEGRAADGGTDQLGPRAQGLCEQPVPGEGAVQVARQVGAPHSARQPHKMLEPAQMHCEILW